jgi:hypothetical protein
LHIASITGTAWNADGSGGGAAFLRPVVRQQRYLLVCHITTLYVVQIKRKNECGALVEWYWLGKTRNTRRAGTCPRAAVSTKNSTLIASRLYQDLRGEKLTTNLLSRGTDGWGRQWT